MIFQAHKGVSTEYPENTMPAFTAAVKQGYDVIELDVSVTKDLEFVILHDSAINRTARKVNGEELCERIEINNIDYKDLLEYDFGLWFSDEYKGTKIPLLTEVLDFAKINNVKVKIDNKYQKFTSEQMNKFFETLNLYTDVACLTCSNLEELKRVNKIFPDMYLHYDGPVSLEVLNRIGSFINKEQLTVWIPHKNKNTSWVKVEFANEKLAKMIKEYASLGVWILSEESHLNEAEILGADIIETNGQLKPKRC